MAGKLFVFQKLRRWWWVWFYHDRKIIIKVNKWNKWNDLPVTFFSMYIRAKNQYQACYKLSHIILEHVYYELVNKFRVPLITSPVNIYLRHFSLWSFPITPQVPSKVFNEDRNTKLICIFSYYFIAFNGNNWGKYFVRKYFYLDI